MSKYKININRETLSSNDIARHMDFDKFISAKPIASAKLGGSFKFWLNILVTSVIVVTSIFMILNNKNFAKGRSESFIKPPVPSMQQAPQKYIINNDRDTSITCESGTRVFIAAGSFVDKNNNPVKGPVEIRYNEFHDQADQLFSGIPMNYDSAGVHSHFESAGMFDIMAYQDGEPLYLGKEKELTVDMVSYQTENNYNVYYLDTVNRQWVYNEGNTKRDRASLANLLNDTFIERSVRTPSELILPRRANPDLNNFVIDYDKTEFPELAAYDGVKFEVEAREKNYDSKLGSTTWEEVNIQKQSDGKHYSVSFKAGKRSISITACPVFEGKDFEKALKEYELMKVRRQKQLLASADSLTKLETAYTRDAGKNQLANTLFNKFMRAGAVSRIVRIGMMGVWNCDRSNMSWNRFFGSVAVTKGPEPHFVSAITKKEFTIENVFLIRSDVNGIYPLNKDNMKHFSEALIGFVDVMIVVTKDKKMLGVTVESFKTLDFSKDKIYFNFNENSNGIRNLEEARALIKS